MKKILLLAITLTQIILANENTENNTSTIILQIDEQRTISTTVDKIENEIEYSNENKLINGFITNPIEGMEENITKFCITQKLKGNNDEDITIKKESIDKEQALEDYNKMVLNSGLEKEKFGRIEIDIESENKKRNISIICVMNKVKSTQSTHKK